jgi:hypothetical protein
MHRYVVQFRNEQQRYFKSDCGFDEFEAARRYVRLVMDELDWVAHGKVVERDSGECVYEYRRTEEQINAVFGEPEEYEDPNNSDGIDDDPFVQYEGPDDPDIRYR